MSIIVVPVLAIALTLIAILIRVKWTNIEVTRQGCNITLPALDGFDPTQVISDFTIFQDGYGLQPSEQVPKIDTPIKVTVYQLKMIRIPYTNIRVGWVYYVVTGPDGLSVNKHRITSVGPQVRVG